MAYRYIATGSFANSGPAATFIDFPPWGASQTTGADAQLTIRAYGAGIQIQGVENGNVLPPYIGVHGNRDPYTLQNGEAFVIVYQQNNCTLRATLPPSTRVEFVEQFN